MYGHNMRIYFCLCLVAIFIAVSSAGKILKLKKFKVADGDRITNGQNATIDQVPSIVQIVDKYAFGGHGFICGGTLISDRHLVSAAHCFKAYNEGDIAIVANATYLTGDNEGAIRRDVDAIYKHPKYDPVTDDYDMVVIKLREPLTFGKGVQKAKMCKRNWVGKEKILVSGWGHTVENADNHSNQLQIVKLNTLSHEACTKEYKGISPKMLCSVVGKGKDACQGDSGGPAFYNGELCGVVSFGFGCGRNGVPAVFASVHELRDFIETSIEQSI